nr:hypothetical protein [Tanacetum cinerariifolium]
MTWHATGKCTKPGLAADGFNLFDNLSQAYNMWPVILTTYNLPSWLCMKESSFMLMLLSHGPKSPGKDIDVYLRPLIDDLKVLWALIVVETIDIATGQKFNMRVMVLWTINYFPARSSLSGWSGQDYKSCPTCNEDTPSSKVVDILCNLELIYPPAFFDIMIHLVIHLPLEALKGGPIRPRWMFLFERFMKKLKGYVRNKAKPEGSIAEIYVTEEALTFIIRFDAQELKKVIWYVLHNSLEIDTYRSQFKSDICSPGGKDGEMYYGQLQEILEFSYLSFKVVLFRVKWFDTSNEGRKVKNLVLRNNMTQILTKGEAFKDDQYILATQAKQCFYLEDMARRQPHWKVVKHVNHKKFPDGGVIVVEEDHDVIHFDNSSDLPLSTNLIDLDEDDDIIDDEDAHPRDLADSDDEDLINVDDDDGVDMLADVARGHDGGGDDRKGTRKLNLGGRKAGWLHTRQETRNLGLKKIIDDKGPVPIRFEWDDKKTLMPLGDHASHWSNYLGELIREMPLYYPFWQKYPAERKAAVLTKIGDLPRLLLLRVISKSNKVRNNKDIAELYLYGSVGDCV